MFQGVGFLFFMQKAGIRFPAPGSLSPPPPLPRTSCFKYLWSQIRLKLSSRKFFKKIKKVTPEDRYADPCEQSPPCFLPPTASILQVDTNCGFSWISHFSGYLKTCIWFLCKLPAIGLYSRAEHSSSTSTQNVRDFPTSYTPFYYLGLFLSVSSYDWKEKKKKAGTFNTYSKQSINT